MTLRLAWREADSIGVLSLCLCRGGHTAAIDSDLQIAGTCLRSFHQKSDWFAHCAAADILHFDGADIIDLQGNRVRRLAHRILDRIGAVT